MSASDDGQPSTPRSRWEALVARCRISPEQEARREIAFQSFVRDWTQDPWRAEQAAKCGEGWLRACFNSAALAYDWMSDDADSPEQDCRRPQAEGPADQGD